MMKKPQYKFYECNNPECGLRFPGYEGYPRWNLCPICRSKTNEVALVDSLSRNINSMVDSPEINTVAMLDNIRSGFNVGSILRTADGVGIRKVYLTGITPTPENLEVQKTSLNADVGLNWEKHNNGFKKACELREMGFQLWALERITSAESLLSVEVKHSTAPIVLIVGNEIAGIDPGIIEISDRVISIPMFGKKDSYNVAIAFSIAASYLLFRSLQ